MEDASDQRVSEGGRNESAEVVRAAAGDMLLHLANDQKLVQGEVAAMGRWLTASLLAINGAGCLAVFNSVTHLDHAEAAAGPFILGILAALGSGLLIQKASVAVSFANGELIGNLIRVSRTGEIDEAAKETLAKLKRTQAKWRIWPQLVGWISAFLFVGGVVVSAKKLQPNHRSSIICEIVKADMLSSKPKRLDDPSVYTALHCSEQTP